MNDVRRGSNRRTRRRPADRLVVADLSVLQGRNRDYRVPDEVGLVIPRTVVDEIAGKFGSYPEPVARGQAGKLFDLFAQNQGRVFLGRNAGELDDSESYPAVRLDARHWIDHDLSEMLWYERPTRDQFVQRASEVRGLVPPTHVQAGREEFSRLREEWTRVAGEALGERASAFRSNRAAHSEWARHPARVARSAESNPRYSSGEWARSLDSFPDRYAWPRWVRLAMWYGLQGVLRPKSGSEQFTNDWEDAQYVHLASFVGELATADTGMRAATEAVFPHVALIDGLP